MKLKFLILTFFLMFSHLSLAARDYTQNGILKCDPNDSKVISDSDKTTTVLFVNGIDNSLNQAEESRKKLYSILGETCTECQFAKVYNQTDTYDDLLPDSIVKVEDIGELNVVGDWQTKAISRANVYVFDSFIQKDIPEYFKLLRKELSDTGSVKGWTKFGEYPTIPSGKRNTTEGIYKNPTPVTKDDIDNAEKKIIAYLQERQGFLNDNIILKAYLYNPEEHGTDFTKVLINDLLPKKNDPVDSVDIQFTKTLYNSFIKENRNYINEKFFYLYQKTLNTVYYSNKDLYKNDATAQVAITKSVESLVTLLKEYVLSGNKVVIVAHSQGNHIVDLAYSILKQTEKAEFMNAIRVVGVASVSSVTPNNVYYTWDEDHTVNKLHSANSGNAPLIPNFITVKNQITNLSDHSFTDIYLSDQITGKYKLPINAHGYDKFPENIRNPNNDAIIIARQLLIGLISSSINLAVPIPKAIQTDSILTAQLRWEDYGDMDLYISEPNGTQQVSYVSYSNKKGTYGSLDLDDTNGNGPEHYYLDQSKTCNDLKGKTWTFYIHQYPRGGYKAAVHLLIKVGGNGYISRSFGMDRWQSDKLKVATVNFTEDTLPNTINFVIKITDPTGNANDQ